MTLPQTVFARVAPLNYRINRSKDVALERRQIFRSLCVVFTFPHCVESVHVASYSGYSCGSTDVSDRVGSVVLPGRQFLSTILAGAVVRVDGVWCEHAAVMAGGTSCLIFIISGTTGST